MIPVFMERRCGKCPFELHPVLKDDENSLVSTHMVLTENPQNKSLPDASNNNNGFW
jgi:hypothetical protein